MDNGTHRVRRFVALIALAAGATVPALSAPPAVAAGIDVVTADDVGDEWFPADTRPNGTGTFEVGPAAPPLGAGSFELSTPVNAAKVQLLTNQYDGVALADITALGYSTYRDPASTGFIAGVAALNLRVDSAVLDGNLDGAPDHYFVFEPYQDLGNAAVLTGVWQAWDAIRGGAARWWVNNGGPTTCGQSNPCPWATLLATYPGATIQEGSDMVSPGSLGANQGSFNAGILSNVDALVVGVSGDTTTFDFEAFADANDDGVPDLPPPSVAAGNQFTCALSGGMVKCWGHNGSGQLGDGTTARRPTPVAVSGITTAVEIVAGRDHSCARLASGSVVCWGDNGYGQLGDGTTARRLTPSPVAGLVDAVALAAGDRHTCALTASGGVKCWGANASGEVGDGTFARRTTPVSVSGVAGASAIAAGGATSCAVVAGGAVKCWGAGGYGQLGNGTANTNSALPVTVTGLTGVADIDVGSRHACAVQASGAVRCWGANVAGALGDGTTAGRTTPVAVSGIATAVQVSVGTDFSCARLGDGSVRCWGWNNAGQLGDGTATNRLTPVAVAGLNDAVDISAGTNHVVARRTGGGVAAWGDNGQGQLGTGAFTASKTPVPTVGFP